MSIHHWLAHRLGWNRGEVHSWRTDDGVYMIGFRCECGAVQHATPSRFQAQPQEPKR